MTGSPASFKFEKRAHPRFAMHARGAGDVVNRRMGADAPRTFPVLAVNAGAGGIQVTLDAEIAPGDVLRLAFAGEEPVEGRVVWVRRNAMRLLGALTAGLAFVPAGQAGIAPLVARARAAAEPLAVTQVRASVETVEMGTRKELPV